MNGKRYTYEEVKNYIESIGLFLISDKYIHGKEKLIIKDNFGYFYTMNFYRIKEGVNLKKFHKSNPYTIQNIKLWCKLNDKLFELLDNQEYIDAHSKLNWECLKISCGEVFKANWSDIKSGYGCGVCYGRQTTLSNCLSTKNPELAKEWHPNKNGNLTPYDVTEFSNKRVWWLCGNGHEWKDKISNRCRYIECPYCNHQRASKEYNLLICNPELCKEWDYNRNKKRPEEYLPNSNKRVYWKCDECGYEWKVSIANRNFDKTGCPKCNKSKGEKEVRRLLEVYSIFYDIQYKIDGCINKRKLPFDFAIFKNKEKTDLKCLIEYDGILHYEDKFNNSYTFKLTQQNDLIKDEYCKNNNIKLLRIPYWEFDNIEEILKRELIINNG